MSLVSHILSTTQSRNWNINDFKKRVNKYENDYDMIVNLLPSSWRIDEVYKIEHPYHYAAFFLKQAEYGGVTPRRLFHATQPCRVDSILETNFDWRRSVRCKYGRGVSFSICPLYAHKYSSGHNLNKVMIITDVLIKNEEFNCNVFPSRGFDTGRSPHEHVKVKFCDDEFYPSFVVHYEKRESF